MVQMDLRRLNQADFEQWANQLGVSFAHVQERAGVKPSRASKMRLGRGEAAAVREKLLSALSELERANPSRTPIGKLVLGWHEWCELGARLAAADESEFLAVLERLRKVVAGREGLNELGVK